MKEATPFDEVVEYMGEKCKRVAVQDYASCDGCDFCDSCIDRNNPPCTHETILKKVIP